MKIKTGSKETLETSSQTDKSRSVLLTAVGYEVLEVLYKCFAAGCSISQGDWNHIFVTLCKFYIFADW